MYRGCGLGKGLRTGRCTSNRPPTQDLTRNQSMRRNAVIDYLHSLEREREKDSKQGLLIVYPTGQRPTRLAITIKSIFPTAHFIIKCHIERREEQPRKEKSRAAKQQGSKSRTAKPGIISQIRIPQRHPHEITLGHHLVEPDLSVYTCHVENERGRERERNRQRRNLP